MKQMPPETKHIFHKVMQQQIWGEMIVLISASSLILPKFDSDKNTIDIGPLLPKLSWK